MSTPCLPRHSRPVPWSAVGLRPPEHPCAARAKLGHLPPRRFLLCTATFIGVVVAVLGGAAPAASQLSPEVSGLDQQAGSSPAGTSMESAPGYPWTWPVPGTRHVLVPFVAPAHDYGPGYRGIDIAVEAGAPVRAPAPGVVAFRGVVVDRPLLTIDHGDGFVSTLEPVSSELSPGAVVAAGDPVGVVADGGHAPAGSLHVGVRWDGAYVNPLGLFGAPPRAVLLPCCS